MWQDDQPRPIAADNFQRFWAGQPPNANNGHHHPLSVPRFPWYY